LILRAGEPPDGAVLFLLPRRKISKPGRRGANTAFFRFAGYWQISDEAEIMLDKSAPINILEAILIWF
jgi:hypothetical protein